jgi:EAL domain-containing protein (putative c-di-GMP-specific phosphodiesterase class I)
MEVAAGRTLPNYGARFGGHHLSSCFQPIVSFSYRRVVGHEGLLRCTDHARRAVTPPDLLADAERNGMLPELDHLARRLHIANYASLDLCEGWLFLNMHPSVFSSAQHLDDDCLQALLADYPLAPSRLIIEILEDSVKDDVALREGIARLRRQGWGIALDDFGAGHSNFDRVWEIKPDIVKLDRSYAVRVAADPAARRMLPSIVALLHEAGSLVLLEGIETAEQAMIAMDADIDLAQGFYFARPGRTGEIAAFTAERVVDDLWPVFEARRRAQRSHYTRFVAPYLKALDDAARQLAALQTMEEACAAFLQLEQSDRCYLLDSDGFQVGSNVLGNPRAATPALAGYQRSSRARWSHRPYFQRAIACPGKAQITRPYRSIATTSLCVTVSASILLDGENHVLCGDLLWKD